MNAGTVRLLDDATFLRECRALERRRSSTGRDRVDHRPQDHDDAANAGLGAVVMAARASRRTTEWGSKEIGAFAKLHDELRGPSSVLLPDESAANWSAYRASRNE